MKDKNIDLEQIKRLIINPKIGEMFIQHKKINVEQLAVCLEEQEKNQLPIGRILIDKGFIVENDLVELLTIQKNTAKLLEESFIELEKLTSENTRT
ncbi:MAG TPA: hypothetical protein P5556_06000 [Candidatus Gastranaerophilales bacterium]|nr:hypothetical protein [Candidatus Gastranaerophilales bacterium]